MRLKTCVLGLCCLAIAANAEVKMDTRGSSSVLNVAGSPFLVIGGELGNSSASSAEDIVRIFPKLQRMNLNTVLVPVYWDMIEPEEGKFDFTLVDIAIDEARKNDLKVIFLWFGAWKNSMSCYAPLWFKKDYKKYPRAYTSSGKPLEIASAFSKNVFNADSKAFEAWVKHIKSYDKDDTVLMLQIENEIGMLEDARDYSKAAQKEYEKGVPSKLIDFLKKNKLSLHPSLLARWEANGMKSTGSWREVFGDDIYSDEYFMAWNYAEYVEQLAKKAKKISSRPVYVNAAMNSRGRKPGEYPSAGPLAHLKDIWHAAAPTIDILAPDLYDKGFVDWVAQYHTSDNPLFIPEIRLSNGNAAQAFYVIGEHDAIGLSPFSIENGDDDENAPSVRGNLLLKEMAPILLKNQGSGNMNGIYFDADSTQRVLMRDGMKITANHFFTLPWDSRATDGSPWPDAGGVIIKLAPMEYIIAGTGLVVKFESETENNVAQKLGEDGFLDSGAERTANVKKWVGVSRIGLGTVDEVSLDKNGKMKFIRRLCGDETHQGRHVRISVDDYKILHVKLYEYR